MAGLAYPLGAPPVNTDENSDPNPLDPLDTTLAQTRTGIMRTQSAFVPPEDYGHGADIVPMGLWRQIQAGAVENEAQRLAFKHDAYDVGFNMDAEATRENLTAVPAPDMPPDGPQLDFPGYIASGMDAMAQSSFRAVAQMQRDEQPLVTPETMGEPVAPQVHSWLDAVKAHIPTPRDFGMGAMGILTAPLNEAKTVADTARAVVSLVHSPDAQHLSQAVSDIKDSTWPFVPEIRDVTAAAKLIGPAFDGRNFIGNLVSHTVALSEMATGSADGLTYGQAREQAWQRFDVLYAGLPRPAQLFIDEFSPGNVALALSGSGLAKVLGEAGPAGRVLAPFFAPLSADAGKAIGLQIGMQVATRGVYEASQGLPDMNVPATVLFPEIAPIITSLTDSNPSVNLKMPARVLAAGLAGAAILHGDTIAHAVAGAADRFLGTAPEGYLGPAASGRMYSTLFPGLTPEERLAQMQAVRDAYAVAHPAESVAPIALTPVQLAQRDYESAQEDLIRHQRAMEILDNHPWTTPEDNAAGNKALADLGFSDPNLDYDPIIREGLRDSKYDVKSSLRELRRLGGGADITDFAPGTVPLAPRRPTGLLGEAADIAMPQPDAVLNESGQYMHDATGSAMQRGDMLAARIMPPFGAPRRSAIEDASGVIPDILPHSRPQGLDGIVDHTNSPYTGFLVADSGIKRAANLAGQVVDGAAPIINQPVPLGIAEHAIAADARAADVGNASWINLLNGSVVDGKWQPATGDKVVRSALIGRQRAQAEVATRLFPSRVRFMETVRNQFGDTLHVPEGMTYKGPDTRPIWGDGVNTGRMVPAAEHPATGTLVDAYYNPGNYDWSAAGGDEGRRRFFETMKAFDARNDAAVDYVNKDFGTDIGKYRAESLFNSAGQTDPEQFRAHIPTINRSAQTALIDNPDAAASAISGRAQERTFASIYDRWADPTQEGTFDPELDLNRIFTANDNAKANMAAREQWRWQIGGLTTRPENAPAGFVQVPALSTPERPIFLPSRQAADVTSYMDAHDHPALDFLQMLRNTYFNGDLSPFTKRGMLSALVSPNDTASEIIGALRADPTLRDSFSAQGLARTIAERPTDWIDYFTSMGIAPNAGAPQEFRPGLMSRLPGGVGEKVEGMNQGMMSALLRVGEANFREARGTLLSAGYSPEQASAGAAAAARMIIPTTNYAELGLRPTRAVLERAAVISPSLIREPAELVGNALSGFTKLAAKLPVKLPGVPDEAAAWATLTPSERMATQIISKMAGSVAALSAASGVLTAHARGYSPEDAALNAVNPAHADFAKLWLGPDLGVPLASPVRSAIMAMMPKMLDAGPVSIPVPFGHLPGYIANRVSVGIDAPANLFKNEDSYTHQQIATAGSSDLLGHAVRLGQRLLYATDHIIPISVSGAIEATQHGIEVGDNAGQTARSALGSAVNNFFAGLTQTPSAGQDMERQRRIGAMSLYGMAPDQKAAAGMTPEQIAATGNVKSLDDLRAAIGTRAANFVTEQVNPATAAARDQYVRELQLRADNGDRDAGALITSVNTQQRLAALEQSVTHGGIVDEAAYRLGRADIIHEQVGANAAFKSVFDNFRHSPNEVDRLSSQWYDLFAQATPHATINGHDVAGNYDPAAFQDLEDKFFASIGADKAALVQQNIAVAPLGANKTEVALRDVRRDLGSAGFWQQTQQQPWSLAQKVLTSNQYPPEIQQAAQRATSMADFRVRAQGAVVEAGNPVLRGYDPATAMQVAASLVAQDPITASYDAERKAQLGKWVGQNLELAGRALGFGYIDKAYAPEIQQAINDARTKAAAPSGGAAKPRSEEIAPEPASRDEVVALWERPGATYGTVARDAKSTPAAVEQMLRRHYGGSPTAGRDESLST